MSFKRETLKNLFQLGSFTYAGEVINFLSSIVLARLLLPQEYGFVAMIYVITNFAVVFSGIGIGSEIIRSNYKYTFHKSMFNLSFIIGLVITVIFLILSYPIAYFYGNTELVVPMLLISTQFLIRGATTVFYSVIHKKRQFTLLGKIEFYNTILANFLMISMAFLGFSYWSLIIPFIITDIFKLLLYKSQTNLKIKIYPMKYTIIAFRYSKSMIGNIMGSSIIGYWSKNLDTLLIGKNFGEAELGLYNRGYRFINLTVKLFISLFGNILYPNLQKLKDENGDVKGEYIFFVGLTCLLSFFISLFLIGIPNIFVRILWGSDWLLVADYLPFFGVIILSRANHSNSGVIYKIYRKEYLIFRVDIIGAITYVVGILIGMLYSSLMVAKMIAFMEIVVYSPIVIFYSFYAVLKFKRKDIFFVFFARLLIIAGILFSVWFSLVYFTYLFLFIFFLHLIFTQIKDINRFRKMIVVRFQSKSKDI